MKALIVGGTSGLGLELAKLLRDEQYEVFIGGRNNPEEPGLKYIEMDFGDIDGCSYYLELDRDFRPFDVVIYSAGFYQDGLIDSLDNLELIDMVNVGLLAPAIVINQILEWQDNLPLFIAITSTSQFKPRKLEPMYCAVKAGLGMLANCLSLDERIQKTLVAAPAGMNTRFWFNSNRDTSEMLDPVEVAKAILEISTEPFQYRLMKILRDPFRVEIEETESLS